MLTVKPSDLEPIEGKPKYNAIYQVQKAVKENLAAFNDQQEPTYRRMHLVVNTATLPGGVAVAASVNQGLPVPWLGIVTNIQQENYLLNYFRDQEDFLTDQASQKCMKKIILKVVPEVYFMQIKHNVVGYKKVTLLQFIQLMEDDFPATPEEQAKIKAALMKKWNPAEHIIHMLECNKKLLEKYNDMLGNAAYTPDKYIQKTYMAIKNTR